MQNFSGEFSLLSKASKLSSSTLNPLNTLPEKYISRVKKDIEDFSGVARRCESMWETVIRTEMIKFPFGLTIINRIFRYHEGDIYKYTKISSIEQFMSVFDVDRDNCLNEDQLISIFVYIKNRVEALANDAIQVQEYFTFKSLMKEVRQLEANITTWQDILRSRISKDQLDEYKEIGDVKIQAFCQKYEGLFERLEQTKDDRRWQLEKRFRVQNQDLSARLSDPLTLVKIKPNNKIKQLQLKQKLVCLEERVDQAVNFRTELNKLEVSEQNRVNFLVHSLCSNQRNQLRLKQQKESQQLEIKLDELQSKMKIQMEKQYNVLIKRNKLHQNQIKKLQAMARRIGFKKGVEEPQLHRTKKVEQIKNSLLCNFKKNNQVATRLLTQTIDLPSLKTHMSVDETTFNLNQREGRGRNKSERMKTVHKYLETNEKEKAYPLCDLYNKSLIEISNPEIRLSTKLSMTEGSRKKTILQKIKIEA